MQPFQSPPIASAITGPVESTARPSASTCCSRCLVCTERQSAGWRRRLVWWVGNSGHNPTAKLRSPEVRKSGSPEVRQPDLPRNVGAHTTSGPRTSGPPDLRTAGLPWGTGVFIYVDDFRPTTLVWWVSIPRHVGPQNVQARLHSGLRGFGMIFGEDRYAVPSHVPV